MGQAVDVFSGDYFENRYTILAELRRRAPVYRRETAGDWLVLRHEDVKRLLSDKRLISSGKPDAQAPAPAFQISTPGIKRFLTDAREEQRHWLAKLDAPEHDRHRRALQPLYGVRLQSSQVSLISSTARDLLVRLKSCEGIRIELIGEYIAPLMRQLVASQFDVPQHLQDQFGAWAQEILSSFEPDLEPETYERGGIALNRLHAFFSNRVEGNQASGAVLAGLLQAHHLGHLTQSETVAQCVFLFLAGHSTTQDLIGSAVFNLLQTPNLLANVTSNPTRISGLVSEALRFDPPTQYLMRWAETEIYLGDQKISRGDRLMLMIASANRDDRTFASPDQFDITRRQAHHLAFGFGPHACLGAKLAQKTANIAIAELLRCFPYLRLDENIPPKWKPVAMYRGLETITLRTV